MLLPLLAGIKVFALCLFFFRWGRTTSQVLVISLLACVAFSSLIFNALPEHFTITALIVVLMYHLVLGLVRSGGKVRWVAWTLLGTVSVGVTVTNLVVVWMLFFTPLAFVHRAFGPAVRKTALLLGLIIFFNGIGAVAMNTFFDEWPTTNADSGKYLSEAPFAKLSRAPRAVADGFCPAGFDRVDKPPHKAADQVRYHYMITLRGVENASWPSLALGGAILLLVFVGAVRSLRGGSRPHFRGHLHRDHAFQLRHTRALGG